MKYIVVGLGNFGASLAEKLTAQGNEVIGIDTRMANVDLYKERISHTICMDATDEFTVSGLPLKDTDGDCGCHWGRSRCKRNGHCSI